MDDDHETDKGRTHEPDEEPRIFKVATPGGRRAVLEVLSKSAAVGTAVALAECGGSSSSPTNTTTTTTVQPTWTLWGAVTDESTGRPISGARVTVMDGPNVSLGASTDANGAYSLTSLKQCGMTAQASASRYNSLSKSVTLTSDKRIDYALRPVATTTTTTTKGGGGGCSCNPVCSCNKVCSCNPLTYWYPN